MCKISGCCIMFLDSRSRIQVWLRSIQWVHWTHDQMKWGSKWIWWGFKTQKLPLDRTLLTHWGRVTHICVGKQTIIGSDNGLSSGRRQAITWTNAGILLIGPFGTNFSEISIKILTFSFTKMRLKVSSAKWRPFCLGLNVLKGAPGDLEVCDPVC